MSANPVHDPAGNMTRIPNGSPASTDKAKFDAWNRLVSLTASQQTVNRYDGLNRRVSRDATNTEITHYYYNRNWQVLTETDGSNNATAIYSYHSNYVDAVAVRMRPNDEHYFTCDHQYSVTAAYNRDTKEVDERYAYSPYGEVTILDADFSLDDDNESDIGNEYLYTGRRRDPGTGLQIHRNRYYSPTLAQWINRDPLGYVDGMSQYRAYFVPGATDPDGTEITKAECRKAVKKALLKPELKEMKARIAKGNRINPGCKPIEIRCKVCSKRADGSIGSGTFSLREIGPKNIITVCVNQPKMTKRLIYDLLRHEFVHAIDHCEYARTSKSCELRICSEIRAYSYSNCYDGSPLRKRNDGKLRTRAGCIKVGTYASVRNKPDCKVLGDDIIKKRINAFYKTCAVSSSDTKNNRLPKCPFAGGEAGY